MPSLCPPLMAIIQTQLEPIMMLVPTYVKASSIHGVGVFAAEPIKAGTLIWEMNELFDKRMTADAIAALPAITQHTIRTYGYPSRAYPNEWILEYDNGRFMNHSPTPNTDFRGDFKGYAIVDIAAGDELTSDYAEWLDAEETSKHVGG